MKLRNKQTGHIGTLFQYGEGDFYKLWVLASGKRYDINSLAELNEDWEDVEPEEVWYIDYQGMVRSASKEENDWFKENEIGNCFGTKEEAEKAVEKLKAWKRLKDKGFDRVFSLQLMDALCGGKAVEFKLLIDDKYSIEDIKLLFGGEE